MFSTSNILLLLLTTSSFGATQKTQWIQDQYQDHQRQRIFDPNNQHRRALDLISVPTDCDPIEYAAFIFLNKLEVAIATADEKEIRARFDEKFHFQSCMGVVSLDKVIASITAAPHPVYATLISARKYGNGVEAYATFHGLANGAMEVLVIFDAIQNTAIHAELTGCVHVGYFI